MVHLVECHKTPPESSTRPLEFWSSQPHHMDFDTDFWSEIQDAPGEIFDIPELWDGEEEEQSWQQFLQSDVTL
jgi:hypothetical protein